MVKLEIKQYDDLAQPIETGAVQFKDQQPGVYITGDHCAYFYVMLQEVMLSHPKASTIKESVALDKLGNLMSLMKGISE